MLKINLYHTSNGGRGMSSTSRFGETCGKTFCSVIMAAVIVLTLLAITSMVMVASKTGIEGMFKVLFPT